MSDLESTIWQKYKDKGVLVYGLHGGEPATKIQDFIEQAGLTFPVVTSHGTVNKFAYPLGVGYPYPRDVVIGPDRVIHSVKTSFNVEEIEAFIESQLD